MRIMRLTRLVISLSIFPSFRLAAQVGHDPAHSPYQDIILRSTPILFFGHLSADRGRAGVGLSNARTLGARYEIPAGRSLLFQFTAAYLEGDRFVIDPRADSTSPERRTGPVPAAIAITDVGILLRLTGGKTWHGIAPYAGVGIGLAYDVRSGRDTTGSGYQFGTKVVLNGATGVRWYPTRRVMIDADLRAQFWRLRYPVSFHTPAPDGSRVVPLSQPLTDWTLHPWISLGIGWIF
ncbi:MAG TPA: hypothetical protein VK124_05480 [Gemmatimonadales bacterium]|nr:hypothetical protein [Gemmatimonadales bacterium]